MEAGLCKKKLEAMRADGMREIEAAKSLEQLQDVRQKWMGKKAS